MHHEIKILNKILKIESILLAPEKDSFNLISFNIFFKNKKIKISYNILEDRDLLLEQSSERFVKIFSTEIEEIILLDKESMKLKKNMKKKEYEKTIFEPELIDLVFNLENEVIEKNIKNNTENCLKNGLSLRYLLENNISELMSLKNRLLKINNDLFSINFLDKISRYNLEDNIIAIKDEKSDFYFFINETKKEVLRYNEDFFKIKNLDF